MIRGYAVLVVTRTLTGAFAIAVIAAVVAHAQQISGPVQTPLRVGTDLITVDASVLDSDRKPIRGLTAEDFVVLEDGKPRPIVAFSAVEVPTFDAGAAASSATSWSRDVVANDLPAEGRLVVILLDRSIPAGAPVQTAREIASAAVNQLGPGDVAAVVRSSGFANDGRVQGFTADRRLLDAAIDSIFTGTTSAEINPSPIPGQAQSTADCHCGLCVFETLGNVAAAMGEAPRRRKVLLFVGSAITIPVVTDACYSVTRLPRDRLTRELETANVTVHAIDPSGVIPTSPRPAFVVSEGRPSASVLVPQSSVARANVERLDNLRVLPEQTGGRLVASTNAPGEVIPAIFDESQSYYLLGFEPAATPDGEFHRIEVRVSRRGTTVRARSGYAVRATGATADASAAPFASAGLIAALHGPQPRQNLRLSASAAPFPGSAGQPAPVAVLLGLTLPAGDGPRRLAIAVGAFDLRGQSVVAYTQAIEVRPPVASREVSEGLMMRLDLAPGQYEIRAAIRDERSGAIGSVFSFAEVPDTAPVMLSGLVLRGSAPPTMAGNALRGLVPFVPTIARKFAATDSVTAFARVQATDASAPVSVSARIVDAQGIERFVSGMELEPEALKGGHADYSLALPLKTLVPGRYLLHIKASLAAHHADSELRFDVLP